MEAAMHRILIADDNEDMRELLSRSLSKKGFEVRTAGDGADAVEILGSEQFDIMLADLRMPNLDGMGLLKEAIRIAPQMLVIMITAYGTVEDAVDAMRQGAFDYVLKPFSSEEIEVKIRKALDHKTHEDERHLLREEVGERLGGLVLNSERMQTVSRQIDSCVQNAHAVFIEGKSGTGKALVAREIHKRSSHADKPFITINCMAIDPVVQELEIFGCERGIRKDVPDGRKGKLELADGGTFYISEVAELGIKAQEKLLLLIGQGTFRRVGGIDDIRSNTRIIVSASEKLEGALLQGDFERPLYDKLKTVNIELPDLCEREDDIGDLAEYFVTRYTTEFHKQVKLSPESIGMLKKHSWPGNVHELENVIARAVIVCKGDVILPSHLPSSIAGGMSAVTPDIYSKKGVAMQLDAIEKELIRDALEKGSWNQSRAAKYLDMKRTTLQYKLKKHGLKKS
jgi:DNA-binding NtrC family response regulator